MPPIQRYKPTAPRVTVKGFDGDLFSDAVQAARGRGQTVLEFIEGATREAVVVAATQERYNNRREEWRAANGTSMPARMRSPPKFR